MVCSGVADVVDPLGGSYAIEALTDVIEAKASEYIKRIDDLGGMVRAIELGFPQREIQNAAYDYQRSVDEADEVVVGVNKFVNTSEKLPEIQKVSPQSEAAQKARLEAFKARRSGEAVQEALRALGHAAQGEENLLPHILHAVKSNATLGEVSHTLRTEFGIYRESVVI